MSIFGFIVIFTVVWWVIFFAALPFGVRRQELVETGHDPGAPANPMLWRKAAITTVIAIVLVGGTTYADHAGWVDISALVFGEDAFQSSTGEGS